MACLLKWQTLLKVSDGSQIRWHLWRPQFFIGFLAAAEIWRIEVYGVGG